MERAQRRVLVQYPKRQVGNRMFGGDSHPHAAEGQHRRASSRRSSPARSCCSRRRSPASRRQRQQPAGCSYHRPAARPRPAALHAALRGDDRVLLATSTPPSCSTRRRPRTTCKKYGGFIPGIRPGSNTADYLDYVLTRLTTIGALYLVRRLPAAGDPDQPLRRAVLLRRHQPDDHRVGDDGHGGADPVASAGASV